MAFVKVNNTTVHYHYHRRTTTSPRCTIIFINSLGTDFRIWKEVVNELADSCDMLLFDNRGHGLSDVIGDTKGLDDFAADTEALIKDLNITDCVIVGLSVGGMIAQLLAHRKRISITRLILCDTRHKIGNDQIWNDRIDAVKKTGLSAVSDGVMLRWFSEEFRKKHPERVIGYRNMLERQPALGYIKTVEAIRDADLTEVARGIKLPTLCLVGDEDKSTTPDEVKSLSDLITGSQYKVIENSGHIPCVDNPHKFSQLITDFLNK